MTKSRTLRKAGAVALSLAMALSIAGTIPASAAAKKVKLSSSKGTITVGKTKKVTIKNTKKANIKKVTFKYSNTKKRVTAKRSGLTLKFKGKKAGKVTITSKITLKKAVAGKKSYSLKYKATVKKATPAPTATPGELALEKVESAGGATRNILLAYFSSAIDDIAPTDVQIRNKATGLLYTVEKVVMGSDKKTATMTLANSNAAGVAASLLAVNTDYVMIVTTKSGKQLEKVFSIPAVLADAVVMGVDPSKKQIQVRNTNAVGVWSAAATYNIPSDMTFDYNGSVANTFTIEYDKTNTVKKITPLEGEVTVYGAFKTVPGTKASEAYLQDKLTETKYYTQDAASGSIPNSIANDYETNTPDMTYDTTDLFNTGTAQNYAYGKLVLNTNGTIKAFWHLTAWSGNIYVASVNGDSIISKTKQEQTLKDYKILKDGKSITVADIKENDVVFYNTAVKLAEVYNNTATGKIEAVYDNAGFKFAGKNRDGAAASYIANGALKTVDTAYLKSLGTDKDVTVIFDRAGQPVYVLGEQAASTTTTIDLFLTKAADGFQNGPDDTIRFVGFDGTAVVTKDVALSSIASFKKANGVTFKSSNGKFIASDGATALPTVVPYTTATTGETLAFVGTATDGATAGTNAELTLSAIGLGDIVTLTSNDKGVVTDIVIKAGKTTVTTGTTLDGSATADFKKGYKTLGSDTLSDSTNVYIINKGPAVEKVAYSAFEKIVKRAQITALTAYASNKAVTDIVIDNQNGAAFGDDADGSTTKEVVVKEVKRLDGKVSSLTVIKSGAETTYSKFGADASLKDLAFAMGDVINITVLKDGETVSKLAADTTSVAGKTKAVYGVTTTAPGSFYMQNANSKLEKFTLTSDATIVKVANNTVTSISISDLQSLALKNEVSAVSLTATGGDKVDEVVVSATARNATNSTRFADAEAGLATARAATTYGATEVAVPGTAGNITTTNLYGAYTAAESDLKVIKADIELLNDSTLATWGSAAALTAISNEIKRAKTYQIVSIKAVNIDVKAASNANPKVITQNEFETAVGKLPTSLHVTMADGSEKDLAIKIGALNNSSPKTWVDATAGDDKTGLYLVNTDSFSVASTSNTGTSGVHAWTATVDGSVDLDASTTGVQTYTITAGDALTTITIK